MCVLVHRQELVEQTSASLAAMGVAHGVIAAGWPETPEPVQVASVVSLAHRLGRVAPFDLLVVDEVHRAVAVPWQPYAMRVLPPGKGNEAPDTMVGALAVRRSLPHLWQ